MDGHKGRGYGEDGMHLSTDRLLVHGVVSGLCKAELEQWCRRFGHGGGGVPLGQQSFLSNGFPYGDVEAKALDSAVAIRRRNMQRRPEELPKNN